MIDLFNKLDILFSSESYRIKLKNPTQVSDYEQGYRSIFFLANRERILNNLLEQPEILHVALKKNQKYLYEKIFRQVNKFLMDTIAMEYLFT